MYDEDDLLPISALQHLVFCERQCALIHIEGAWAENMLTAQGRELHERAHEAETVMREGVRTCRGLRLRSLRLGLTGQADVVEFHRCDEDSRHSDEDAVSGAPLAGLPGLWRPFPVEYKRGRPKPDICDEVQLCAQALCLEEMLNTSVPAGAIFYGQPRRRMEVTCGPDLRRETERLALRLHEFIAAGITPPAGHERKCRGCSMLSLCLPETAGAGRSALQYLDDAISEALQDGGQ